MAKLLSVELKALANHGLNSLLGKPNLAQKSRSQTLSLSFSFVFFRRNSPDRPPAKVFSGRLLWPRAPADKKNVKMNQVERTRLGMKLGEQCSQNTVGRSTMSIKDVKDESS